MPHDEKLVAKIRQLVGRRKNVTEKKMFLGVAFLPRGNVCCGAWQDAAKRRRWVAWPVEFTSGLPAK